MHRKILPDPIRSATGSFRLHGGCLKKRTIMIQLYTKLVGVSRETGIFAFARSGGTPIRKGFFSRRHTKKPAHAGRIREPKYQEFLFLIKNDGGSNRRRSVFWLRFIDQPAVVQLGGAMLDHIFPNGRQIRGRIHNDVVASGQLRLQFVNKPDRDGNFG